MKRFINFGSIPQFRNVVKQIQHDARYIGVSDNGEVEYNHSIQLPVLNAVASEKIHGTNAAVCFSNEDGMWFQSRKNMIHPGSDNAGCAAAGSDNADVWMNIIAELSNSYGIDLDENIITVFYEWCGGGIQKTSALTGKAKSAMIFLHFSISPIEGDEEDNHTHWYPTLAKGKPVSSPDNSIYNIGDFPLASVRIDFKQTGIANNAMVQLTIDVEGSSGVANAFGLTDNVGEGWVCTIEYKGQLYRWKTKGEKHSASKVKTLKPVDVEKENLTIELANQFCNSARLEQAWQTIFGIENELGEPDMKKTGDFIRAVIADIVKEESDIMIEANVEPKQLNSKISQIARGWFIDKVNSDIL
jgi:hypothetical protein